MSRHNKNIGDRGEDIAVEYLVSIGYSVLTRNFKALKGELDIVLIKDEIIHIVEVKSRVEDSKDTIADSLNQNKINSITKASSVYLSTIKDVKYREVYFDLVIVIFNDDGSFKVDYTERFFYPSW